MISSADLGRGSGSRFSPKRASRAAASVVSRPVAIDVSTSLTTASAVSVCHRSAPGRTASLGIGPGAAACATTATSRRRSSAVASNRIRTLPVTALAPTRWIDDCPVSCAVSRAATSGRRRRPSTRRRARPGRATKTGTTAGSAKDRSGGRRRGAAVVMTQRTQRPAAGGRAAGLAGRQAGALASSEAAFGDVTRHLGLERTMLHRSGLEDDVGQEPDQQMYQRHRTTSPAGQRGPVVDSQGT